MLYNIWLAYKFVTKLYDTDDIYFLRHDGTRIQMSNAGMREYLKGNACVESHYEWYGKA
jgi:hypothetical protein